jgi:hypothetical protein
MTSPGSDSTPWAHPDERTDALEARWQLIDAPQARRLAPISWHIVQRLRDQVAQAQGNLRAVLTQRLAHHLDALEQSLLTQVRPDVDAPTAPRAHGGSSLNQAIEAWFAPGGSALVSLEPMRQTHARLKIRQQLRQSLSQPLRHAGPLHSERLVQQSLERLSQWSDAYLHRMMTYVDALATLEDAQQLTRLANPKSNTKAANKTGAKSKIRVPSATKR